MNFHALIFVLFFGGMKSEKREKTVKGTALENLFISFESLENIEKGK